MSWRQAVLALRESPHLLSRRILQLLERTRVTVADCLRGLTSSTPTLKKFRNSPLCTALFFHEYGRRVGMVPRSSLKEGKNSQMVEKRTKTPKPNQHQTPQAHRPSLHHLVVFPLCQVKRVKRKLMTINGPEFSNEKQGSAGLCSRKVSKKASNGLYFKTTGDQRPHHSVAKQWSRCRSGVPQCSNAGCNHINQEWQ